jgi:hypothetical protein
VVDRGSNRRVSKNHIGGVKVSRIAFSVIDRRSNKRVSKNHIGDVKVSGIECGNTLLFDPRSTTLKAILLTFTSPM